MLDKAEEKAAFDAVLEKTVADATAQKAVADKALVDFGELRVGTARSVRETRDDGNRSEIDLEGWLY